MRAMVLQQTAEIGPQTDPLTDTDLAVPEPKTGEALLRVELCAVCHTELDQIEGRVATPLPRVPGHQVVGTVEQLGDGVDPSLGGRRVGVGWIASACCECRWCERGEENLCPDFAPPAAISTAAMPNSCASMRAFCISCRTAWRLTRPRRCCAPGRSACGVCVWPDWTTGSRWG